MILLRQKNYTKIRLQKKYVKRAIENIADPKKAKKYVGLVNDSSKMTKGANKMTTAVRKSIEKTTKKTGLSRNEIGDRLSDIIG